MAGLMAQFPNQNHHGNNHQPAAIALHEFTRLNPTVFRYSEQPLDANDWLHDITHELESADLVTFVSYFLKGSAAQWWDTHMRSLPDGTVMTWNIFQTAFRARHIPRGIMDRKRA